MNAKRFKLSAPQIRRLIPPMGGSIATDTITVDGRRVGHMLRSPPHNAQDSGWQFMAGGETQAYMDEAGNHGIYDLNTIANYDPSIIEFLTYSVGTAVARGPDGRWCVVGRAEQPEMTLLPAVERGAIALTSQWQSKVLEPLLRRFERGSLVLWRPGLTFWIATFQGPSPTAQANMAGLAAARAPQAFALQSVENQGMLKLRYELDETDDRGAVRRALQMIVCDERAVLTASAYCDSPDALHQADCFWDALRATRLVGAGLSSSALS